MNEQNEQEKRTETADVLAEHLTEWSLDERFYTEGYGIVYMNGGADMVEAAMADFVYLMTHIIAAACISEKHTIYTASKFVAEDIKAEYLRTQGERAAVVMDKYGDKYEQMAKLAYEKGVGMGELDRAREGLEKYLPAGLVDLICSDY